ncbi:GNAT family N-acetyltransferase [Actinomadura vinacea]|uniref:GNAT family N-acetyltransferase n=1 Tax=Actinomadura vinacea TaxID=115336 RepID=A0ABP5X8D2_9ACTN
MEIRVLDAAGLDATRDLRSQGFGALPDGQWAQIIRLAGHTLRGGRQFAGYEDGRPVATARIHDLPQWWHGRPVSMGGVGGVVVAPEARGRGVGRRLMTEVLERCTAFGHALSVLYPATTPLYRSLGWEHAGSLHRAGLPAEALREVRADASVGVRRAGPDDAAEVAEVIRRVHRDAGHCGPIDWGEKAWRIYLADRDVYHYLAEDGFLAYHWGEGNRSLEVELLVAASEATLRALWALVGTGSSIVPTVYANVAPHDPVFWLTRERTSEEVQRTRWMLRVLDAPAAVEARGFPPGVSAEAALEIDDPQLPANTGSWRLVVKDGTGRLERGDAAGRPAVRVGARGLAALYGGVPTSTLRATGLLEGDAPVLDAVFAAAPFALDHF